MAREAGTYPMSADCSSGTIGATVSGATGGSITDSPSASALAAEEDLADADGDAATAKAEAATVG